MQNSVERFSALFVLKVPISIQIKIHFFETVDAEKEMIIILGSAVKNRAYEWRLKLGK